MLPWEGPAEGGLWIWSAGSRPRALGPFLLPGAGPPQLLAELTASEKGGTESPAS